MICPRECKVERQEKLGYCGANDEVAIARVAPHFFEEPPLVGTKGSGTVFFNHCNLSCLYCQNMLISRTSHGLTFNKKELVELFLRIQEAGLANINLVSPGHYLLQIRAAIIEAKQQGLAIPIVYNSNAYEKVDSLRLMRGLVDIYLPDLKYYSSKLAKRYSDAPDYFTIASEAIKEMRYQVKDDIVDSNGLMLRGLIVRHLVLPGSIDDSKNVIFWLKKNLGQEVRLSVLRQYTPMYGAMNYKPLNRKLTTLEYQRVVEFFWECGLENGYFQEAASASSEFTPDFSKISILI